MHDKCYMFQSSKYYIKKNTIEKQSFNFRSAPENRRISPVSRLHCRSSTAAEGKPPAAFMAKFDIDRLETTKRNLSELN